VKLTPVAASFILTVGSACAVAAALSTVAFCVMWVGLSWAGAI
jgi:hypothetical protein